MSKTKKPAVKNSRPQSKKQNIKNVLANEFQAERYLLTQNGLGAAFGLNDNPADTTELSQVDTLFKNNRWYLISNMRQLISEIYVEHGLIQTIVDVPVDDGMRGGVDIKSKQLDEEQIEDLQVFLEREDILGSVVGQATKWNRLYGGAGVLIMTDQDPAEPLNLDEITEDSPLEFRDVDMWELFWDQQNIEGYYPELQMQKFEFYSYYSKKVHKSRVMPMKGLTAPSFIRPRLRGWGFSIIEALVRSINQYLKSNDLSFEVMDEFKIDVYRLKNLANTLLSPNGEQQIRRRTSVVNQIKNYQNSIVMDAEDEYMQKQLSFAGLAEAQEGIRLQVASDMRMPLSKIFGQSAKGFNSGEDDIENYNGMVESQVRSKTKFIILKILEIKCQQMFGFIPDDLTITFKPLRILSAVDEETVKTQKFARVLQARQAGEIDSVEFRDACNRDDLLPIQLDTKKAMLGLDTDHEDSIKGGNDYDDDEDPAMEKDDPAVAPGFGGPSGSNKPDQRKPQLQNDRDSDEYIKAAFEKMGGDGQFDLWKKRLIELPLAGQKDIVAAAKARAAKIFGKDSNWQKELFIYKRLGGRI